MILYFIVTKFSTTGFSCTYSLGHRVTWMFWIMLSPFASINWILICSSLAQNLNNKGIFFFYLKKMSGKKSLMCLCVFSIFCRSCSPWAQEIGSWSRPLCMTVFLSQALVWLSCSSSWVCAPTFKLLLWKPTKNKKKIYLKLMSPDLNQENKKQTVIYLICKIYDYMANTFF